jgi:MFS family permease
MFERFRGWGVVGAVALALTISGTTFAAGSFGILTAYLNKTYGWSQAQMAPALSTFLLCATVCVPVVGLMVDRFGTRLVACLGMAGFACVLAAGSLIRSIGGLYLFYAALGFVGAFTNPVVYLRAIAQWFDRRRDPADLHRPGVRGRRLALRPAGAGRAARAGAPARRGPAGEGPARRGRGRAPDGWCSRRAGHGVRAEGGSETG